MHMFHCTIDFHPCGFSNTLYAVVLVFFLLLFSLNPIVVSALCSLLAYGLTRLAQLLLQCQRVCAAVC